MNAMPSGMIHDAVVPEATRARVSAVRLWVKPQAATVTADSAHIGHPGRVLENVNMLAGQAKGSRKPYYLMSTRAGVMNAAQAAALREAGLVQIGGTRPGLVAIDRVGRWMMGRAKARAAAKRTHRPPPAQRATINEFEAKRVLAAYGVPLVRAREEVQP